VRSKATAFIYEIADGEVRSERDPLAKFADIRGGFLALAAFFRFSNGSGSVLTFLLKDGLQNPVRAYSGAPSVRRSTTSVRQLS
jgi:hypothetical protein